MRTWSAADPEPDDHPELVDDLGEYWTWDSEADRQRCACGTHVCQLGGSGWWSPTLAHGELISWREVFDVVHPSGACATTLHEIDADTAFNLCRELYS